MRDFLKASPWQYAQYRILLDKPGYRRPDREGIVSQNAPGARPILSIQQISALNWLVEGATEDHRLFLHCEPSPPSNFQFLTLSTDSGHGDQSPTSSASEPDGFDESTSSTANLLWLTGAPAIIPVDCPPPDTEDGFRGAIRDNLLRELVVDALPNGCNLTAIFEFVRNVFTLWYGLLNVCHSCCHSGSILDLRYCYPRYANPLSLIRN